MISNSSAFRMDEDVPLLIPEVNHEHLRLLERQRTRYPSGGFIVTNPNCSTIMIALALAPLHAAFGVEACVATTLQALSGAGYPGVASLDILDNVLPHIGGEEEKIETETKKILGRFNDSQINAAPMAVSAQCHRVNVSGRSHGCGARETRAQSSNCRSCVKRSHPSVRCHRSSAYIQRRRFRLSFATNRTVRNLNTDRDAGNGMTITIGRLMPDAVLDYRFVVLSHNTIRGAAGAAILNAELLIAYEKLVRRTNP